MTPLEKFPKFAFDSNFDLYKKRAIGYVKVTPYGGLVSDVAWHVTMDGEGVAIFKRYLREEGAAVKPRPRHITRSKK
jgi:hypothetical protein